MDREHQTQDCRYRHQERLRKFLRFNSATRVRRAMTAVAKSTIDRSPSTTTATAIVLIAAAVTPSTKAFTPASFPYFEKYGAGITVKG